jgi:outer membrane protein
MHSDFRTTLRAATCLALGLPLFCLSGVAAADDEPPAAVESLVSKSGGAGLGLATRFERSPYRGGGTRNDLVPIYVYEGKYVFLEAYRAGFKLQDTDTSRVDLFVGYRFEGFPYDRRPASLTGMVNRDPGVDLGLSVRQGGTWGTVFGEVLHDISKSSEGTEVRAGYRHDWNLGNLRLQPQISLAARNARLNDYYYGVRTGEATATRAAYSPGSGVNAELSLSAIYRLSERWRVIGGVAATRWASGVRNSPIVENRMQLAGQLGLAYDFSPKQDAWPEGRPVIVKVLSGKATDCDVAKIMLLRCFSTNTVDHTRIAAVELGRPFVERLNGWPLDFVGYVGLLHHDERGLQSNSTQLNAYMKAYYYGFPWASRVRTRLGFGVGVSYAETVPYVEQRDQIARGRNSSRLLNYLDPSIDISVGDLVGSKAMAEAYVGLGVSHRSGVFGTSRMFGNVNGGSNYIYSYLEWRM